MFSAAKTKAKTATLKVCVYLVAFFILEHAAGAAAIHYGLLQGHVVPPQIAFGGFDAAKDQQLAMLGDALPSNALTPVRHFTGSDLARDIEASGQAQRLPVPSRKPQVTR